MLIDEHCLADVLIIVSLAFLVARNTAQAVDPDDTGDVVVSFAMFDDPRIDIPPGQVILSPGYLETWMQLLGKSDVELRRQSAMAIEKAHRLQYADMSAAIPELRALLNDPEGDLGVRVAAATALVTMDDKESAQA